jgi:hypothetical protein
VEVREEEEDDRIEDEEDIDYNPSDESEEDIDVDERSDEDYSDDLSDDSPLSSSEDEEYEEQDEEDEEGEEQVSSELADEKDSEAKPSLSSQQKTGQRSEPELRSPSLSSSAAARPAGSPVVSPPSDEENIDLARYSSLPNGHRRRAAGTTCTVFTQKASRRVHLPSRLALHVRRGFAEPRPQLHSSVTSELLLVSLRTNLAKLSEEHKQAVLSTAIGVARDATFISELSTRPTLSPRSSQENDEARRERVKRRVNAALC